MAAPEEGRHFEDAACAIPLNGFLSQSKTPARVRIDAPHFRFGYGTRAAWSQTFEYKQTDYQAPRNLKIAPHRRQSGFPEMRATHEGPTGHLRVGAECRPAVAEEKMLWAFPDPIFILKSGGSWLRMSTSDCQRPGSSWPE